MQPSPSNWYAVRTVLAQVGTALLDGEPAWTYKERITLWAATSVEHAVALAEAEAVRYGSEVDATYLGEADAVQLTTGPTSGSEVFSSLRTSLLGPNDYLRQVYGAGEKSDDQGTIRPPENRT
jgi:hypothetical protein